MAEGLSVNHAAEPDLSPGPAGTPKYLRTKDHVLSIEDALGNVGRHLSRLQRERLEYEPLVPEVLQGPHEIVEQETRQAAANHEAIAKLFPQLCRSPLHLLRLVPGEHAPHAEGHRPLRIGVVLSGGQAPGGHNVITGIFDYLAKQHPGSVLIGFKDGPRGIINNDHKLLTARELEFYRNQGGFHLICSGRDKIEKPEQLKAAKQTCKELGLDGLVVIGGDDSNTNAAVLAEYFLSQDVQTCVVGVPKTIDGDLKTADVPISFGFDTASKVYSELIGNVMTDASSAKKYYHFVRLMGRAASHVTLECALQTHPQVALISEEVDTHSWSLHDIASRIADVVVARAEAGKNYGVVLVPEGLVEYVHDVSALIVELNELLAKDSADPHDLPAVAASLTPPSRAVFESLPAGFKTMLLEERDPHGNVQVSHIETEKLLIRLVEGELAARRASGRYAGKFAAIPHFFGYEGRCSLPTNFDASYCYALGHAAASLVGGRRTGVMATVSDLQLPAARWRVGGTPLVAMMCLERRKGAVKPVIRKALVDLNGPAFRAFAAVRRKWGLTDCFRSPGPIQFSGTQYADVATMTLGLEINDGDPVLLLAHGLTNY
ncbi:hypothetical protein ACKKBG_A25560 [Auxenochlorella protothecoides x Auxenochlorella symbiontica]